MKKILLLAAAALMVSSASAQLKHEAKAPAPARPQSQLVKPEFKHQVMQKHIPGTPFMNLAPKKDGPIEVGYRRPAGAFPANISVTDGAYAGVYYASYIALTPYADYTFNGYANGVGEGASYLWKVQSFGEEAREWTQVPDVMDLTWMYAYETDSVPIFRATVDGGKFYEWYIKGYEMGGSSDKPSIVNTYSSTILAVPSTMEIWEEDILKSSKNFCYGGRNGTERYPMGTISGAEPYGRNASGWWAGKNGFHQLDGARYFVDGIGQAFEKPTVPYLLKQVVVMTGELVVKAPVDMECRIYKLDEIPAYTGEGEDEVVLPEEPGELIAKGRATVTPETNDLTGGLVVFDLYGEIGGLEYNETPTIDCPILVVIDGYNDDDMSNLTDFCAMFSTDDQVDEGFGELAYLKFSMADENGEPVSYGWHGVNNFFSSGKMMTGLTIFLSTENPYLTFRYFDEDGKYHFPNEGGVMVKDFGGAQTRSIEFFSWVGSADDAWIMSCDGDDVPEWLNIELTDGVDEDGEFNGVVNALVTAEPLPAGMSSREAVVRFEFPGAYIDYTFTQGEGGGHEFLKGDVNNDGEVGIADVNALINLILGGEPTDDMMLIRADVNEDGEIGIADVNYLVTLI